MAGNGNFGGAGAGVRMGQPHFALAPGKFLGGRHSSSFVVSVDVPLSPATSPYFLRGGGIGKYGGMTLISTSVSLLRKMDFNSLTT